MRNECLSAGTLQTGTRRGRLVPPAAGIEPGVAAQRCSDHLERIETPEQALLDLHRRHAEDAERDRLIGRCAQRLLDLRAGRIAPRRELLCQLREPRRIDRIAAAAPDVVQDRATDMPVRQTRWSGTG